MPITLGRDSRQKQGWLKRRKRRSRRTRTFESAIAVPQAVQRGSKRAKRADKRGAKRRKKPGGSQATRTRTARTRAVRKQRARQATAASVGVLQRIQWWSLRWRLLALVLLAGLLAALAYLSFDYSFFVYRDSVRIEGLRYLQTDEIFSAAGVNEQNIFWVDPAEVAKRVVALDGIKVARVRCSLPTLVTIEVEEREPVVMWRAITQGQDLWLDETGMVLPYHGDVNAPDMVFVVDHGERHLEVADRIEPEGIVQSVLQLAAALPGEQVFQYQPGLGLNFTHRVSIGEWQVYVGTSEDLARKIQVVQALTEYLVEKEISPRYVDVRWPEHPVYGKPGGEGLAGGG